MANWRGRGKGRKLGQPSVPGIGGVGRGGGRAPGQPSVPGEGGIGKGGGRAPSQPSVPGIGGPGRGGGRPGFQPWTYQLMNILGWDGTGRGGGRSALQPTIEANSALGSRTTNSTVAWQTEPKGASAHVADPEGNYIFALEIDGIEVAQFLECSGLKSSTEVFELQEGGMNHRVHKLPGQTRWENIQLRYGVTNDVSMLQWRSDVVATGFAGSADAGAKTRKNGAIVVKNNQMQVVRRYEFVSAWPVAWEGPNFSSSSAEIAIETVELAHHGIYVSKVA